MDPGRVAWAAGAYLVGTFPSAYLVARARGASSVVAGSGRGSSHEDAHVLLRTMVGGKWGALAVAMDVSKSLGYALAARLAGDFPPSWLAVVGVLLVVGYAFPFYARAMAGRGLAAASGVLLALLPLAMIVTGAVVLAGYLSRKTGPASTLGFALASFVAALLGRPAPLVAMAALIFAVILLRRLEGTASAARLVGWPRSLAYRLLLDTDPPPSQPRLP